MVLQSRLLRVFGCRAERSVSLFEKRYNLVGEHFLSLIFLAFLINIFSFIYVDSDKESIRRVRLRIYLTTMAVEWIMPLTE